MIRQMAIRLATKAIKVREKIIVDAINHAIGLDWAIEDIRDRGVIKYWPNGIETFCFDGVNMVEFHHSNVHEVACAASFKIKHTQYFKLLYSPKKDEALK